MLASINPLEPCRTQEPASLVRHPLAVPQCQIKLSGSLQLCHLAAQSLGRNMLSRAMWPPCYMLAMAGAPDDKRLRVVARRGEGNDVV